MAIDIFETLLQDLKEVFKIDLKPDRLNTCLIKLPDNLTIQIEMDERREHLIIGSNLGEIPSGKYREQLFKDALRANGLPYPINGILAYSTRINQLVLYDRLDTRDLTGEKLRSYVQLFLAKAKLWHEAIAKGEVPTVQAEASSPGVRYPFGLKP